MWVRAIMIIAVISAIIFLSGGYTFGMPDKPGPEGAAFTPAVEIEMLDSTYQALPWYYASDLVTGDLDGIKWQEWKSGAKAADYSQTDEISHFSQAAVITRPAVPASSLFPATTTPVVLTPTPSAACFLVSSLLISPQEADCGETVRIKTVVINNGGTEGTCELVLKINGVENELRRIRVAAGKTESVSFEVTREEAGQYAVEVNGKTGQFTVKPASGTVAGLEEAPETSPYPASVEDSLASKTPSTSGSEPEERGKAPVLGWVMIGSVILAAVVGVVIMRRRKS